MSSKGRAVISTLAVVCVLPAGDMVRRKVENPEASWAHIALNSTLAPFHYFKVGLFGKDLNNQFEDLIKSSKAAGVENSETLFRTAKYIVNTPAVKSMELSPFGFLALQGFFQNDISQYIRTIQYYKDVPQVADEQIKAPVAVVGLFRAGTTHMHRLLALDPSRRAPKFWELRLPTPGTTTTDSSKLLADREIRRKQSEEELKISREVGGLDRLDTLHIVRNDLPEECQLSFMALVPVTIGPLFYGAYTTDGAMQRVAGDMPLAYGYYKKVLQTLQYQDKILGEPVKKWVLKGPIHLHYLPALNKIFPDVELVWIHRDPKASIPSLCSMIDLVAQMYCEYTSIDRPKLGKGVLSVTEGLLQRAADDVESNNIRCCHVKYDNLIKDPVKTIKEIYAYYGWQYTDEYDSILKKYLEQDAEQQAQIAKEGKPKHCYPLEKYGLTAEEIQNSKALAWYKKRFSL